MAIKLARNVINEIKRGELTMSESELRIAQFLYDEYYKQMYLTVYVKCLDTYAEMLMIAFNGIKSVNDFITPNKEFNLGLHDVIESIKINRDTYNNYDEHKAETYTEFQSDKTEPTKEIPQFLFDDYGNFEFNIAWMIKNYPKKYQELEAHRAQVQALFYEVCNGDYYYPDYLHRALLDWQKLIKEHKKKRSIFHSSEIINHKPKLISDFLAVRRNSNRGKVLQVFEESQTHEATIQEIKNKTNLKTNKIYESIYGLKENIKNQHLTEVLKLDRNENDNGYKFTFLAS